MSDMDATEYEVVMNALGEEVRNTETVTEEYKFGKVEVQVTYVDGRRMPHARILFDSDVSIYPSGATRSMVVSVSELADILTVLAHMSQDGII